MKAARYYKYGGPEVIEIKEIEKPNPTDKQVLVENWASSINPFDFKVRNGNTPGLPREFPVTIGGDFSGKIIEIGSLVKGLSIGDEIYGQASVFGGASGSMAEYLVANLGSIAIKPSNIDFAQAASLPLTGISAIQALEDHIRLEKGQSIFINGGSGGIGSIAIQIAKHIGAFVTTTVGTENVEFADALGADIVIDYKKEKFEKKVKNIDAVFDTSGIESSEELLKVIKKGGILVSMTSKINEEILKKYDIKVISQNSQTTADRLNRLRNYVEKDIVKPELDRIFRLDQVLDAFSYQEKEKIRGKVVVRIK